MVKQPSARILIVDSDLAVGELLATRFRKLGYPTETATTASDCLAEFAQTPFELVLLDQNLPDSSGLELACELVIEGYTPAIALLCTQADYSLAVEAMRLGMVDYITKPLEEIDDIVVRLERVLDKQTAIRRNYQLLQELQEQNELLEKLVVRDPLTGLYNHAYFQECLDREVGRAMRFKLNLALLFIDLDNFKSINDSVGHQSGDRLLEHFARILRDQSRSTDLRFGLRMNDIAARYGGDEFAIILPETPKGGAAIAAERLREAVESTDFGIAGITNQTVSIGVAALPDDATTRGDLIQAADTALYAAKRHGRNQVFTCTAETANEDNSKGESSQGFYQHMVALERSITNRDFEFHYQAIVDANAQTVVGHEALCRPRDSVFNNPAELFAAAEAAGRVQPLGRVLRSLAIAPMAQFAAETLLFVNIHPHELNDPELLTPPHQLAVNAKRLVLDITDVSAIQDRDRLRQVLQKIRQLGFRVALDDLGSSYIALHAMADLEPDFVKLDMSLVRDIDRKPRTGRLLKHLCEYASDEGTIVIAEGVENAQERDVAINLGCQWLQGYFFSRPQAL